MRRTASHRIVEFQSNFDLGEVTMTDMAISLWSEICYFDFWDMWIEVILPLPPERNAVEMYSLNWLFPLHVGSLSERSKRALIAERSNNTFVGENEKVAYTRAPVRHCHNFEQETTCRFWEITQHCKLQGANRGWQNRAPFETEFRRQKLAPGLMTSSLNF